MSMFTIMKIWRKQSMNENAIVCNMISFIEEKERDLQVERLTTGQVKSDIVKLILDELERETSNENK